MMYIREIISNVCPKAYAQVIIISTRYSMFRKQGVSQNKEELNILKYQTQQEKVLPRIAEYYAMTVDSSKTRNLCIENGQKVLKKDFSILQETHSNLCFSKCLFSEICQDGMEILRRSMGGHGTSYYSGVPQIMNELERNPGQQSSQSPDQKLQQAKTWDESRNYAKAIELIFTHSNAFFLQ